MHCLYCDRPLALLKRLTGDGEFCSKEHRKIYQQQHSQLALARLLESQPKPGGKERPRKDPEVTFTPPELPKPAVERQPPPAEFLPEDLEARAAADLAASSSVPRFEQAPPPELGEFPLLAARHGDLAGGGPRTAAFLSGEPQPQPEAPAQRQQKSNYKRPSNEIQLEEGAAAKPSGGETRMPSGAGFVFRRQSPTDQPGIPRQTAKARFGPLAPIVVSSHGAGRIPGPALRLERLIFSSTLQRIVPGKIRPVDATPRWRALEPVLPFQERAKITLVLGTFVHKPIRLAGQDRLPDLFEMQFLPISFPQYGARMGCLEERLHRTDRIGFTPP